MFSSILSIHWPNNTPPVFDTKLKTSVNLFRILISYLSEKEAYLENLQPNTSYLLQKNKEFKGVYKCLSNKGTVVFELHKQ